MDSSLPDHLIIRILALVVNGPDDTSWTRRVELSSVSKTWRRVALGSPEFWAGLTLHPGCQGLREMLPRWQNVPRSVHVDLKDGYGQWKRISDLHRELLNPKQLNRLTITAGADCTRLEEIMELLPSFDEHEVPPLVVRCIARSDKIPGRLFTIIPFGALHHLSLENCSVDWEPLRALGRSSTGQHYLTGLHTLLLTRSRPPLPIDILDIFLSTSPHLESLHLVNTLPDELSFPSKPPWRISSLRTIHLEGPLDVLSKLFLRIMTFPIRADLKITFKSTYSGPHLSLPPDPSTWRVYDEVLQAFVRFINESGSLNLNSNTRVEIYEQEEDKLTLTTRMSDDSCAEHDSSLLEMEFPPTLSSHSLQARPRPTFLEKSVRFPTARHLVLHSTSTVHLPKETWCQFFEAHPHVEVLELKARYMLAPIATVIQVLAFESESGLASPSPSRGQGWRKWTWPRTKDCDAEHVLEKAHRSTEEDTPKLLPNLRTLVIHGLRSQRDEVGSILATLKALLVSRSPSAAEGFISADEKAGNAISADENANGKKKRRKPFLVELVGGGLSESDVDDLRRDAPDGVGVGVVVRMSVEEDDVLEEMVGNEVSR